jgi:hypothetical protein
MVVVILRLLDIRLEVLVSLLNALFHLFETFNVLVISSNQVAVKEQKCRIVIVKSD